MRSHDDVVVTQRARRGNRRINTLIGGHRGARRKPNSTPHRRDAHRGDGRARAAPRPTNNNAKTERPGGPAHTLSTWSLFANPIEIQSVCSALHSSWFTSASAQ